MRFARSFVLGFFLCSLLAAPLSATADGNPAFQRKTPPTGYYVRGAFAVGLPQPGNAPPTQVGFTVAAGGRWLQFIGFEGEFAWGGGGSQSNNFTILGNTRVYPLTVFEATRDFDLEPYMIAGMGGGHTELAGVANGQFVFNLGGGVDWMVGEHVGMYSEVAHRFHTTNKPPFDGVTNFNFGLIYKF